MLTLIAIAASIIVPLAPSYPDPPAPTPTPGYIQMIPNYLVQGDGTRVVCTPTASYCWPSNDGLPPTLIPS